MSFIWKPLLLVGLGVVLGGCSARKPASGDSTGVLSEPEFLRDLPPQVRSFIERKEQLALTLAKKLGVEPDGPTLEYFRLAKKGEFRAASRICHDLAERGGIVYTPKRDLNTLLPLPLWAPLFEVQLTLEAYAKGAGKFAAIYGEGIVQSIPPGSIYFGGTDPGHGLVAAFATPATDGDPFRILAPKAFADGRYLTYLRTTYGDKAYMPSDEDSQRCFERYLADAKRRCEHDLNSPGEPRQLKPGEDVKLVDGKPQVSGQVAVMAINGLLARVVFDKNPDREFFVEEGFPIDWMYPYLTPHGPIMKINRQPVEELAPDIIASNHEFWNQRQVEFIGGWLTPETSVKVVCDFAEKVFLRKDLTGFKGDAGFVRNDYVVGSYAKLRCSQAGVYNWRVTHSRSPEEQQRMIKEADFAYRQALAFCPSGSEFVFRYVNLLVQLGRLDDAILIVHTATKLDPSEKQFEILIKELERMRNASGK